MDIIQSGIKIFEEEGIYEAWFNPLYNNLSVFPATVEYQLSSNAEIHQEDIPILEEIYKINKEIESEYLLKMYRRISGGILSKKNKWFKEPFPIKPDGKTLGLYVKEIFNWKRIADKLIRIHELREELEENVSRRKTLE